jgi:hypothetical protein
VASWDATHVTLYYDQDTFVHVPLQVPDLDPQIYIGGGDGWTAPPGAAIADLRLYAGPLSKTDVANLYQAGLLAHAVAPTQKLLP